MDEYFITKGGAYYRPKAQGYTSSKLEAGRFTLEEAIQYSHPNGPLGPRDGIRYELAETMTTQPTQEAPSSDVVGAIELWFFRDILDNQRRALFTLAFGKKVSDEAKPHAWQRMLLHRLIADLESTAGDTLKAENERLREALQWYAKEYNWRSSSVYMCGHSGASAAEVDRGNKARTALGSDQ